MFLTKKKRIKLLYFEKRVIKTKGFYGEELELKAKKRKKCCKMGKEIKPKYTNKAAEKYSDDDIKLLLKSIKYFDKLVFDRQCVYKLEYYDKRAHSYEFDNLYDTIRFLLAHRNVFIRYSGAIELFIVYKDDKNLDINAVNKAKDADVLDIKYRFERYSRSCVILLSKDLSQVYTVHYYSDNDFSGYGFSYDMKYLYDKEDCIEIKPYTAYTTDIDYGDTYRYGKYNTNVKVPWFISDKELNQNCELMYKYNCSGYGVGGEFQITCSDGIIYADDMRSSPYSMMPIAAIHPCSNLRPIIDGITRYKFIIKFPDGEECPHYVECRTGDMSKAVELLADYDWVYDDICKNPKKYIKSIEVVPNGEWF